ncbi:hypothetical protein [Nocardia sp. NPDC050412]|uniref:hypothetical protein n=1 Tax=Nocardia sp. NPDC050412 TaxID=3364320 RepID=UPI00379374B3
MSRRSTPRTSHQAAADRETAAYRREHDMPEGTEVQHWTKVRSAARTGMVTERMNRNLSPLQSRSDEHATTLLTTEGTNDRGTTYTVHERADANGELSPATKTHTTEHKFADRYLIPAEEQRLTRANPTMDAQDLAEAAGAQVRWKMTGDPGDVSPELITETGPFADARRADATAPYADQHGTPSIAASGPTAQQISHALEASAALEVSGVDKAPAGPCL